ncbi:PucR family transcriptional regulator [Agromyces laixinhei]|uniref:PucR family transcriptional regulator n=1 Tax=Agromyces laixinhei TaxID=2585717 RepID=UPI00143DB471|nr:PucR family transcriptional regulator [Agromyces laixinhei]
MAAPELTLSRLLDRYRFAQLEPVIPFETDRSITGVVTDDELWDAEGALVLGIGLTGREAVDRAAGRWAGAAALVIRSDALPVDAAEDVARAVAPTALLSLGPAMSWLRFSGLVSAELEGAGEMGATMSESRGDSELHDFADSIAALVGGPVTIEDMSSAILAFSSDQDRADEPRKRSILERRVSRVHNEILARAGVFDQLYSSTQPVFVTPTIEGARPRAAIRIKAGEELLGSIWAVVDGPLSVVQSRGMLEASNVVGLSMLRRRLSDEAHGESRLSLVTRLVEGGSAAAEAARELGIGDAPAFVMAIRRTGSTGDDLEGGLALRSLSRVFASFIASVNRRAAVAEVGSTIYAVIPVHGAGDPASADEAHVAGARRFAEDLLRRVPRADVTIGYGELVTDITQLARSRRQADAAVRVSRLTRAEGQVAYWRDVQVDSLMLEIVDTMISRHETLAHPLDRLAAEEERSGIELVPTLSAYLEHFGDVTAAAASLYVHPNTFRYRLRKIGAAAGIELDDARTRFELLFQLRLERYRGLLRGD